jgi:hypothetical protein
MILMGMGTSQSASAPVQQTTVTKSDPWSGQQGYLSDVMSQAKQLSNKPLQYYPGNTVIPFSSQTQQAMNNTQNIANSQSGLASSNLNNLQSTINGNYLNSNNPYASNAFNSYASGSQLNSGNPTSNAIFNNYAAGNQLNSGNSSANNALTQTANGSYLTGGAGFNAALDAATRRIMPQIDSQAAATGQVGGSARDRLMAQTLGDSFANLYGQERQNQLAAAGQLNNQYAQQQQNQLGAAGQLADQYAQQQQNQLGAAGQLSNQYQQERNNQLQAQALQPTLMNAQYLPQATINECWIDERTTISKSTSRSNKQIQFCTARAA